MFRRSDWRIQNGRLDVAEDSAFREAFSEQLQGQPLQGDQEEVDRWERSVVKGIPGLSSPPSMADGDVDRNGDGVIDEEEFQQAFLPPREPPPVANKAPVVGDLATEYFLQRTLIERDDSRQECEKLRRRLDELERAASVGDKRHARDQDDLRQGHETALASCRYEITRLHHTVEVGEARNCELEAFIEALKKENDDLRQDVKEVDAELVNQAAIQASMVASRWKTAKISFGIALREAQSVRACFLRLKGAFQDVLFMIEVDHVV